jgi:hypothetical protein
MKSLASGLPALLSVKCKEGIRIPYALRRVPDARIATLLSLPDNLL